METKTNNMEKEEKTELQRIAEATERTSLNVAFFTWMTIIGLTITIVGGLYLKVYNTYY